LQKEKIKQQAELIRQRDREAAEKRTQERIGLLLDTMPMSVWGATTTGQAYYCSQVWTAYSGLTARESNWFGIDAAHPDDMTRVRTAIRESFQNGHPLETEVRYQRANDGVYRWHLLRASPDRDDAGSLTGWIGTATDIEEHKRSEQARIELLAQEREARAE